MFIFSTDAICSYVFSSNHGNINLESNRENGVIQLNGNTKIETFTPQSFQVPIIMGPLVRYEDCSSHHVWARKDEEEVSKIVFAKEWMSMRTETCEMEIAKGCLFQLVNAPEWSIVRNISDGHKRSLRVIHKAGESCIEPGQQILIYKRNSPQTFASKIAKRYEKSSLVDGTAVSVADISIPWLLQNDKGFKSIMAGKKPIEKKVAGIILKMAVALTLVTQHRGSLRKSELKN
ncbi:MAG: hypothetical protein K2X77_10115 [Candidatus Obscuribacterales bacterium]|jgi:hypothetical protein|nr:hypothetical protein [Candidatus Obscuribacterales bacterium]